MIPNRKLRRKVFNKFIKNIWKQDRGVGLIKMMEANYGEKEAEKDKENFESGKKQEEETATAEEDIDESI